MKSKSGSNAGAVLPPPLQQVDRTWVIWDGRRLAYFGGCDYFRISSHPVVRAAFDEGARLHGLNVAASRVTTGNHVLYQQLEERVAEYFEAEAAVVVSSGYVTNLVVAQALAGDLAGSLIDESGHGSLRDASRFLDCPLASFAHCDSAALARAAKRGKPAARRLVMTDGMFSHDGRVAPLRSYLAVLPPSITLLVDDAHGAGVLGANGRGTLEHEGVDRARIIQTLTFSKAFGVYGGAILGPQALRERIIERSHLFSGNTPLPLPYASAALRALQLLATDTGFRSRLRRNTDWVKQSLLAAGLLVPESPGPIVPFVPRDAAAADLLRRKLLSAEIHPPFIRYPGGPPEGYFRFALSSEHTRPQLERLIEVLGAGAKLAAPAKL
jgi:7-keto-8-aminopelargonate synthetase-like enzyme